MSDELRQLASLLGTGTHLGLSPNSPSFDFATATVNSVGATTAGVTYAGGVTDTLHWAGTAPTSGKTALILVLPNTRLILGTISS